MRKGAWFLCVALRQAGAVISIKSILEPVLEIPWLGKLLVFSRHNVWVFPKCQGWIVRPLDEGGGFAPYKKACEAHPQLVCLCPTAFSRLCSFSVGWAHC